MAVLPFVEVKYMSIDPDHAEKDDLRVQSRSVNVRQFVKQEVFDGIMKVLPTWQSLPQALSSLRKETQVIARTLREMQGNFGAQKEGIKGAKQESALIRSLNKLAANHPRIVVLSDKVSLASNIRDINALNTFLNRYVEHQIAVNKNVKQGKVVSHEAAEEVYNRARDFEQATKDLVICCGDRNFLGDFSNAFSGKINPVLLMSPLQKTL